MRTTSLIKNIAWACAAVALLSVSAGGFALVARAVARASEESSVIAGRARDLAEERAAANAAEGRSMERIVGIERIWGFLVRRQPVAFVEQLEAIAKKTGNAAALDADEASDVGGIVFRITLEGTRETVARFVRAVESMPYLARVEEMSFQSIRAEEAGSFTPPSAGARLLLTVRATTE